MEKRMESWLNIEKIETQIVLHKRQNANQNTTASNNEEHKSPVLQPLPVSCLMYMTRPLSSVHPSFELGRTQTS